MPTLRTSKKKTSKKTTSKKTTTARPRQLVDDMLIKVTPQVQKRMDQLIDTLQNTKEARIGDLKWLGGQILLRSRDVSDQLKTLREQSIKAAANTASSAVEAGSRATNAVAEAGSRAGSAAVGVGKRAASAVGLRTSKKKTSRKTSKKTAK